MIFSLRKYAPFLNQHSRIWICLLLTAVIIFAYGQVKNFTFIDYDDNVYVTENHMVRSGLTVAGVTWAFKFGEQTFYSYWQPLTWLSHMLDVQLYGMNAGYHHLTSVTFHIVNSLLLFLVLNTITGKGWQCTLVASLFALHPLNVESVAWVAARKNVLSTFFWLLTMLSYSWYVRRPVILRYLLTLLTFTLGLMAKPMLVTLPFVLILLDFWPLNRFHFDRRRVRANSPGPALCGPVRSAAILLFLEKIPFLILSAFVCYLSSSMVQAYQTAVSADTVALKLRMANALVSYVKYILKTVWPQKLAILYPFPSLVPAWQILGAVVFLAGVSFLVIRVRREKPYFVFGWLWYLGTLVPVLGFVQAGIWPEMADRWAYVPSIGLFIMIAWGVPDILSGRQYREIALVFLNIILIATLITATRMQLHYWQNSITLFKHTLRVTKRNPAVHNNLGVSLEKQGRTVEAIRQYEQVLQIDSNHTDAHNNLGNALSALGKDMDAASQYKKALKINPRYAKAHFNLGNLLLRQKRINAAISRYTEVLRIEPWHAEAYNNLGSALVMQGRTAEAIRHFREAVRLKPDYAEALSNLETHVSIQQANHRAVLKIQKMLAQNPEDSRLHFKLGRLYKNGRDWDKASAHYQKALSIEPGWIEVLNDLGIICAQKGEYNCARSYFKKSIAKQPDIPDGYYLMASIYARQNRTHASVEWLRQAVARGFNNWNLLKTDRNLEAIRETAYYQNLIKKR